MQYHCRDGVFMFASMHLFPQELRLIFPNAQRLNRGNYVMTQLVQACVANDITDLIIIHEHRGDPGNCEVHVLMFLMCMYTQGLIL